MATELRKVAKEREKTYNSNVKHSLKELFLILLGSFLLALGVALFILPNDILTGGLAGISLILAAFIPLEESTLILLLSIILLFAGGLFLGKHFFMTTFIGSLVYPLFTIILKRWVDAPKIDPLLAAIYGGLICGIGVGLVLKQGSSTGGMDVPPLILNKLIGYDIAKSVMITDALTVFFGFLSYGLEEVLVGLISVYVSGIVINKVLTFGGIAAKSVEIISSEYEKINQTILTELDRGTTLIKGQGGYTKKEIFVLYVIVSFKEYQKLLDIIRKYDPEAFVIVSETTDVHGEGFNEIVRI